MKVWTTTVPGAAAPARAARDLAHELERALARAKVGHVEGDVGGDDADERDVGKSSPLATIWVPTRILVVARAEGRRGSPPGRPLRRVTSRSSRATRWYRGTRRR